MTFEGVCTKQFDLILIKDKSRVYKVNSLIVLIKVVQ
jgi:hypothetical protein